MKKILFVLSILLVFVCLQTEAQTKRALIVAIGNYPNVEKNMWKVISSPNDVPLIKGALEKQDFKNITVLLDSQGTKTGIENALDKLISSSGPGDIIVIHFSTHGQQLEDDGDDEVDGLDEAIVPYGAAMSFDRTRYPQLAPGYIRDDVFGEKMTLLRNKIGSGGDVLVIMDACHSGTASRGAGVAKIRGGAIPLVSVDYGTKKLKLSDERGVFKEEGKSKLNADAATYVLISGAQAQEPNFECSDDNGKPVGSLSFAFSKAMGEITDTTTTYRALFALIENTMREKAKNQKPVLEGDGIDRMLFGGEYVKQEPYFKVDVAQSNKTTIVIKGGEVSGITAGSIISFYPIGTLKPADNKLLNKGTVTGVKYFTATVKLDKPDDSLFKKAPLAFVTELAYGGKKIKLGVNPLNGADKKIQTALKSFQLVEFTKKYDLFLDTAGSVDDWVFKYAKDGKSFADTIAISDTASIKEILKRYDRFQYLQNLSFQEKGLSAEVELLFLDQNNNIDHAKKTERTKFGRLELKEGDTVYLKIKNTGDRDFYVNVVDIQPDGNINPVMPNKNLEDKNGNPSPLTWDQCIVARRDSLLNTNLFIEVFPPFGEESLKVFLSADPLDLEDILTGNDDSRSRNARGVLNNLAKVFVDSKVNEAGSRGIRPGAKPKVNTAQNGTIFSINFNIVPN